MVALTYSLMIHDCRDELRNISLKATPARVAVLKFLEKTEKPVDVATMIEDLERNNIKADQATVFRIISVFTDRGLTRQIELNEGKSRYELRSLPHHHHAVCTTCGAVQDIGHCEVRGIEKKVKRHLGFTTNNHKVELFGICANCQ